MSHGFIGRAVAVVVLVVAELCRWSYLSNTSSPRSGGTSLSTTNANTYSLSSPWSGVAGLSHGFVDRSVAVVVLAVAEFGCTWMDGWVIVIAVERRGVAVAVVVYRAGGVACAVVVLAVS